MDVNTSQEDILEAKLRCNKKVRHTKVPVGRIHGRAGCQHQNASETGVEITCGKPGKLETKPIVELSYGMYVPKSTS